MAQTSSVTPQTTQPVGRRLASLDGLRGIAAVVVVIHHALLVSPPLSAAYVQGADQVTGLNWLITYTPLHIFWAGTEAVYVFFVLSGLALALSFYGDRRPVWGAYYPRRLLRLYLPVWASVAFSVLTFAMIVHRPGAGLSGWVNLHNASISLVNVARDTSLMFHPGVYASPLWSLQWEVLFSILLPVLLWVIGFGRQVYWPAKMAVLLAAMVLGHLTGQAWLFYLPMFGIGILMVTSGAHLRRLAGRLTRIHWAILSGGAVLSLTAQWSFVSLYGRRASEIWPTTVLAVVGASLLVFVFSNSDGAKRLASLAPFQWLGKRSFSLYLIHEPVVVSVAFAFKLHNGWVALAISLPVALVISSSFFIVCEAPAHRLANRVGRAISLRYQRPTALPDRGTGVRGAPSSTSELS